MGGSHVCLFCRSDGRDGTESLCSVARVILSPVGGMTCREHRLYYCLRRSAEVPGCAWKLKE
ncbi:MAG: hypothetical protein K2P59_00125 [Acetatifactor sp.]|nr:hypothetical protein [Acetatifactor sp.]